MVNLFASGGQDTLFCWIVNRWPLDGEDRAGKGWLFCDDGPGELADFIHFDDRNPGKITLILVKASQTAGRNRRISVSSLHEPVGKALQELRFVRKDSLIKHIAHRAFHGRIGPAWHRGEKKSIDGMLDALGKHQGECGRCIALICPSVTRSGYECLRDGSGISLSRMKQLDTLLESARAICASVGVEFIVVAEDDLS